jgi:coproporphyrinogen III oxidase
MAEGPAATELSALGRRFREYVGDLQSRICTALEALDGRGQFGLDRWDRPGGGGGATRVMQDGGVFEKAGVNTSAVTGQLPEKLAHAMNTNPSAFFATGISLVLHPHSPMVPTVHANFRYFEQEGGKFWFGGGIDLTPYYVFEEDIRHFHRILRETCDRHGPELYPRYKKWCDEYFFLRHRGETRGVGGIFFDDLQGEGEPLFAFVRSAGDAFLPAYVPIVNRRAGEPWGEQERKWQLFRRGRYVEFNLVYDRGTSFGLETDGRAESILMSLPPLVRWGYNIQPAPGSREALLTGLLTAPRTWA